MKKLLLLTLFTCTGSHLFATHIIGGDMSYQYVGNDTYHVVLHVYRDCFNGQLPLDSPAYVFAFNAAGILVQSNFPALLADDTLSFPGYCTDSVPGLCTEQGTYEFDLVLPPFPGGYTLVFQRCCRSIAVLNITDAANQGITVVATIPDTSIGIGNNSPVFNYYPPVGFCLFSPINFDQSATDPDGDSLVYELATPISGGSQSNTQPLPPPPPPYSDLTFIAPYSTAYPFDASPPFAIDAVTGVLSGTPTTLGVFALAYVVKEYRGGLLLGKYQREITIYNVSGVATGNADPQESPIAIFPVPASDRLNISFPDYPDVQGLNIYNAYGQLVHSENFLRAENLLSLSVSHLPGGIYYLRFITAGAAFTRLFEMER